VIVFIQQFGTILVFIIGQAVAIGIFLVKLKVRVDCHEEKIESLRIEQIEIKEALKTDTREIKDELKRVSTAIGDLKADIAEMVGFFRGKGHHLRSMKD
jgi:hypothetical protein